MPYRLKLTRNWTLSHYFYVAATHDIFMLDAIQAVLFTDPKISDRFKIFSSRASIFFISLSHHDRNRLLQFFARFQSNKEPELPTEKGSASLA